MPPLGLASRCVFMLARDIDEAMIDAPGLVQHLEATAVPMGSVFSTSATARVA